MTIPAEILAELEALRDSFRQDARQQVLDLAAKWAALSKALQDATGGDARAQIATLAGDAHRLAGTAATFALAEIAEAARALEFHLEAASEAEPSFPLDTKITDRLVEELERSTR